ncbi:MarR family winged helix-turn-helix transcriptional regulator [Calditrichota bacterium]
MDFNKEQLIGFWLNHLGYAIRGRLDQQFQEYNITGMDAIMLVIMATDGASCLLELAKNSHISQSTIVRNFDRLEQEGYIVREVNPADRRRKDIVLQKKALDIVPVIRVIIHRINSKALKDFAAPEKLQLFDFMKRIAHNVGAEHLLKIVKEDLYEK